MSFKLGRNNLEQDARTIRVLSGFSSIPAISPVLSGLEITVPSGDPKIIFDIAGTDEFAIGVDDSDSDRFKLSVGGFLGTNDVWTVDASGNMGFGISPPVEKFHFHGGSLKVSQLNNPDATGGELELHGTYTTPANQDTAGLLRFRGRNSTGGDPIVADVYGTLEAITAGAETGGLRFVLQEGGVDQLPLAMVGSRVIIGNGTDLFGSPDTDVQLDVRGGIQVRVETGDPLLRFDIAGANLFFVGVDGSDGNKFKISGSGPPGGTGDHLTIDHTTKRVGIGITNPDEKFHVDAGNLKVSYLDSPTATGGMIDLHGKYTTPAAQDTAGLLRFRGRNSTGGDPIVADMYGTIEVITAGAETGGVRFVLQEGGVDQLPLAMVGNDVLVGNGTSLFDSPEHELDVRGTIQTRVASGDPKIIFDIGGVNKFALGVDDSDGDRFKLATGSGLGSSDLMTIDASGNFGIGINPPTSKFHIHGGDFKVSYLDSPTLTGGVVEMHGTYTTPAAQDTAGLLRFRGRNSTGGDPIVADMYGTIEVITALSETGGVRFVLQEAGVDQLPLAMVGNDVLIGNGTSLFDSPEHELDVRGTIQSRVASGDPQIIFDIAGVDKYRIGVDDSDGDKLKIDSTTLGTNNYFVLDGGKIFIGDTANANMTTGLTINQGAADDEILALKSSDVVHGMTVVTEADTYAFLRKIAAASGGLFIRAFRTGVAGPLALDGMSDTGDTLKSTNASGYVRAFGRKDNGAGDVTNVGANENLFAVVDHSATRFVVDAEGDIHYDGTNNPGAWDAYDDVGLLAGLRGSLTQDIDLRQQLADWVEYARPVLEKTGVVTYNDDGHHFISHKGLTFLQIDALRQLYARNSELERRVTELERGRKEASDDETQTGRID